MSSQGYIRVRPACFFAGRPGAGPCDGELIRAHLIPKQRIKREARAARAAQRRGEELSPARVALLARSIPLLVWDPRCWVPMCGGPMGQGGHHGAFDAGGVGKLVIARADLPPAVEEYAEQYGLGWSLDADYGPMEDGHGA